MNIQHLKNLLPASYEHTQIMMITSIKNNYLCNQLDPPTQSNLPKFAPSYETNETNSPQVMKIRSRKTLILTRLVDDGGVD